MDVIRAAPQTSRFNDLYWARKRAGTDSMRSTQGAVDEDCSEAAFVDHAYLEGLFRPLLRTRRDVMLYPVCTTGNAQLGIHE